jgi:hypothetical protein
MVYQVTASLLGVEEKRKQFASLSADELRSALKAAPIPVVLGFETHFVIDHHRFGRALSDGQTHQSCGTHLASRATHSALTSLTDTTEAFFQIAYPASLGRVRRARLAYHAR